MRERRQRLEDSVGLLKNIPDVGPQGPERIRVKPIRLALRWSEEIADGGSAEPIQESQDPALLHDE